ncbi:MAG: flagellar filament capping protein FliD [Magnetococcus sp. DMHC-1]|nr:flagellar filament capping protein FliD [Magnetococcales bacterium]
MALGSVTFGGLASGLPSDIVDQLMKAEQTRMTALQKREALYTSQRSAISDLKTKLLALNTKAVELKDPSFFRPHTVTSSDTTVFTATASSDAQSATHSVTVTTLAANQSISSNAGTGPTTSTDTLTAGATIRINYNGTNYDTAVSASSTLADVAAAINNNTTLNPSSTTGVDASVLYDGTNYRLVLRAREGGLNGAAQRIDLTAGSGTLTFAGGSSIDFTGGAPTLTQNVAGVNASVTIDGVAVSSTSNTVSTALTGVTLNLLATGANKTLAVANDTDKLKESLNDFISSFNDIVDFVNKEGTKGGRLQKDASLARTVLSQVRQELQYSTYNTSPTGGPYTVLSPYSMLAEIGIRSSTSDGKLSLDSTAFATAVAQGYDVISSIFTINPTATDKANFDAAGAKRGLSYRLNDLLTDLTASTGSPVSSKIEGISYRITSLGSQMDREQARLDKVRERLTLKFANLEKLTNSMQGQGTALQQALSGLK